MRLLSILENVRLVRLIAVLLGSFLGRGGEEGQEK